MVIRRSFSKLQLLTEPPLPGVLLAAIAGVVVLWFVADVVISVVFLSNVSHVSGAWMVLARDLASGTFYRPLFDPLVGYGGTRFMPVFFSLHALLIWFGCAIIPSGMALSLVSGVLLVAAVVALLKRRGVSRLTVLLAVAALLSFVRVRAGFTSIRGDLLPVAFALWGAWFFLGARSTDRVAGRRDGALFAAGLLFALAFLTKITSLFAFAAAVSAALLAAISTPTSRRRELSDALVTAAGFVLTAAVGLVLTNVLSAGTFLETFRTSATGGADDLTIWSILRDGLGAFRWQWRSNQVSFRVLLIVSLALAVRQAWFLRHRGRQPLVFECLLVLYSGAGVVAILSSPGAEGNHLVDLMVAGVLFVAVGIEGMTARSGGTRFSGRVAPVMLAGIALLSMRTNVPILFDREDQRPKLDSLADVMHSDHLVLSENPTFLIYAGKEARILDAFMLRIIRDRDAAVSEQFLSEIRRGAFDLALVYEPDEEIDARVLESVHFGPGFREELAASYERQGKFGTTAIYRPTDIRRE